MTSHTHAVTDRLSCDYVELTSGLRCTEQLLELGAADPEYLHDLVRDSGWSEFASVQDRTTKLHLCPWHRGSAVPDWLWVCTVAGAPCAPVAPRPAVLAHAGPTVNPFGYRSRVRVAG